MNDIATKYDAWTLASSLALGMMIAWFAGRWFGSRFGADPSEHSGFSREFVSSKLGAYLALFSLLLGFTFSMALSRHEPGINGRG
jgi:hypothetical protein